MRSRALPLLLSGAIVMATACSADSESKSTRVVELEAKVQDLEAQLSVLIEKSTLEDISAGGSTTTSTSLPIQLSRETLAALKDCYDETRLIISVLDEGQIPAFAIESAYNFELFSETYQTFRSACGAASEALDLDILMLGSQRSLSELYERLRDFNLTFLPFDLAVISNVRRNVAVMDWKVVRAFPPYLLDFLETYRSR